MGGRKSWEPEEEGKAQVTRMAPPRPLPGKLGEGQGTYGRQLVEAGKELIEELHELLGAAG